jgi:hypothetical protein
MTHNPLEQLKSPGIKTWECYTTPQKETCINLMLDGQLILSFTVDEGAHQYAPNTQWHEGTISNTRLTLKDDE